MSFVWETPEEINLALAKRLSWIRKRRKLSQDVADIFVRVNSGGQSLTENNFIQTLISVYENETRDRINDFAAASRVPADNTSYNALLAVEPAHLIRMAVGVGFRRARLRYAYMLLRGKNLEYLQVL